MVVSGAEAVDPMVDELQATHKQIGVLLLDGKGWVADFAETKLVDRLSYKMDLM